MTYLGGKSAYFSHSLLVSYNIQKARLSIQAFRKKSVVSEECIESNFGQYSIKFLCVNNTRYLFLKLFESIKSEQFVFGS